MLLGIPDGKLRGTANGKDILAINPNARQVITFRVVLAIAGCTPGTHAHAIVVVLADKNYRQLPKLRHIEAAQLSAETYLSLIGGPITIQARQTASPF